MATSTEHAANLADRRPSTIDPSDAVGSDRGRQRMLDVWCSHEAHRWDTHISRSARGPFGFAGATVHSELASSQIPNLIETLKPDLLVHHERLT
jgi:hypothetical protein